MSGVVPVGPIVDADGNMTEVMRALLQELILATGDNWKVQLQRVDDTHVKVRMRGKDGVWRSTTLTLS